MPHPAIGGPLAELDFRHSRRFHPVRVLAQPAGRWWIERSLVDLEFLQPSSQVQAERVAPPGSGSDLTGELQRAALVVADEDRADTHPRPRRVGKSADHELLSLHALDLLPIGAARADPVRRVAQLADDALRPQSARIGENGGAISIEVRVVANDARSATDELVQGALAVLERLSGQILAIQSQQIEREIRQASATVAELLEELKARDSGFVEDHELAVQERVARPEPARRCGDLGKLTRVLGSPT